MVDTNDPATDTVTALARRFYFAIRAAMEAMLRPHQLGSTQYYVLHQLANHGPKMQRYLGRALQVERATLSRIVATLLRKGADRSNAGPPRS
ncbi:MAG: MarR family transcriptional regulator, partial [Jatrophihabitantaceae bacterium]|nr:MarR family transcriptional regulator [Jatrophihabitantaceae bacterium]